ILRFFHWPQIGAAELVSTLLVFLQRTVRNRFAGWKRPARRKRVRGRLTKKSLKVLRALLSMSAVGQARHLWKNRIVLRLSVKKTGQIRWWRGLPNHRWPTRAPLHRAS